MAEAGTTMAAPAFSLRKEDLVTLLVGTDEEEFVVHESCITRNSDFFKAAMKKEWNEGQTRTVKLPDEHCLETFKYYLNFTYREKLPTEEIKANKTSKPMSENPLKSLAKMYVLGERMIDKCVQHAVIKEIIRLTTLTNGSGRWTFPGLTTITIAYEGTSPGSPLRRLLVDQRVTRSEESWIQSEHPEFLMEFSKALLKATLAQKTVCDFRSRNLVAEDYFK